jgi:hypothetical protein
MCQFEKLSCSLRGGGRCSGASSSPSQAAPQSRGLCRHVHNLARTEEPGNESEFYNSFATIAKERIGGTTVAADPFFFAQREQLVALAERNAVPSIY